MSLDEVADIYLPLSRLLNLYVGATQSLHGASGHVPGLGRPGVPFVIGVAGSVAVGKSTTSRVLQALLARWPSHPRWIWSRPTASCCRSGSSRRGGCARKGFPESYDVRRLVRFLADVKSGVPEVRHRSTRTWPTTSCRANNRSSVSRTS